MYIFRTSITLKDGTKIYAKDYGKKAFRIWIGPDPEPVKRTSSLNKVRLPVGVPLFHRKIEVI